MNNMPVSVLLEHIKSANDWASEMSEVWTNTLIGDFIDREKEVLKNAVNAKDWDKAYESMTELVNLCNDAERKAREEEIHV